MTKLKDAKNGSSKIEENVTNSKSSAQSMKKEKANNQPVYSGPPAHLLDTVRTDAFVTTQVDQGEERVNNSTVFNNARRKRPQTFFLDNLGRPILERSEGPRQDDSRSFAVQEAVPQRTESLFAWDILPGMSQSSVTTPSNDLPGRKDSNASNSTLSNIDSAQFRQEPDSSIPLPPASMTSKKIKARRYEEGDANADEEWLPGMDRQHDPRSMNLPNGNDHSSRSRFELVGKPDSVAQPDQEGRSKSKAAQEKSNKRRKVSKSIIIHHPKTRTPDSWKIREGSMREQGWYTEEEIRKQKKYYMALVERNMKRDEEKRLIGLRNFHGSQRGWSGEHQSDNPSDLGMEAGHENRSFHLHGNNSRNSRIVPTIEELCAGSEAFMNKLAIDRIQLHDHARIKEQEAQAYLMERKWDLPAMKAEARKRGGNTFPRAETRHEAFDPFSQSWKLSGQRRAGTMLNGNPLTANSSLTGFVDGD